MPTHKTLYFTGIGLVIVAAVCALFYFSAMYNPMLTVNGILAGVVIVFLAFFITGVVFIYTAYDNSR